MENKNASRIKVRHAPEEYTTTLRLTDAEAEYLRDLARELNCVDEFGSPTHNLFVWLGEVARRLREARDAVIQRTATALGPHKTELDTMYAIVPSGSRSDGEVWASREMAHEEQKTE